LQKNCGFQFVFGFYKINWFFWFGFLQCVFFNAYALYRVLFSLLFTELVGLIVSRSDSELEVQRYSMKKNTLTVDPIMLEDEL